MDIQRVTPGIQRVNYRPVAAVHKDVARVVVDLLDHNSMVILSGANQPFVQNRQIGKTLACQEIMSLLAVRGKSSFFQDVRHILKYQGGSYLHLDDFKHVMLSSNQAQMGVNMIDEIQHAFPRDISAQGKRDIHGKPIYRGEEYNRVMFAFWQKVSERIAQGGKYLFITALHPLNAEYQDFLINDNISPFFSAPVVELQFEFDR